MACLKIKIKMSSQMLLIMLMMLLLMMVVIHAVDAYLIQ